MDRSADELMRDGSVTVEGAVREFSIGRSRLYELMGRGELPYSQMGARRLIPRRAIALLIAANLVGVGAHAPTAVGA